MIVINLYGGPGTGKSSTAADLFAKMKWEGHNVEIINEYAKKVTWEGHHNILRDQIYLFAKQNRKLERLRDQVDWVITDSPLPLCGIYAGPDYFPSFQPLIWEVFNSYRNINIMLERKKAYNPKGRNQTEKEARTIDVRTELMLIDQKVDYHKVAADPSAKDTIYDMFVREL